jgi:hypothetical protein
LKVGIYDRLLKIHSRLSNNYVTPRFISKWISDHFDNCATLIQEECGIVNREFYRQKTVPGENINKPQTVSNSYKPYIPPVEIDGADQLCFSDDLAQQLGLLEFKKRSRHIIWNCCNCSHCMDLDEEDGYCDCHAKCVCWCNNKHFTGQTFVQDNINYKLKTEEPKQKCVGHNECKK